jgi:hypothetical protein
MSGYFFDFASQNQKNNHSFKIFFGGVSRQRSFETASKEMLSGAWQSPAPLSRGKAFATDLLGQAHSKCFWAAQAAKGLLRQPTKYLLAASATRDILDECHLFEFPQRHKMNCGAQRPCGRLASYLPRKGVGQLPVTILSLVH